MKIKNSITYFCLTVQLIYTSDNQEKSIFEKPITTIFRKRNIGEILQQKHPNQVPPEVIAWLCTPKAQQLIHEATGEPNKKEHGYREKRIERATNMRVHPNTVMVLNTDHETLQSAVTHLEKSGYSYNFLIDKDGSIHPVTGEGESLKDALEHKPNAIRKACMVHEGSEQRSDMEERLISIALIGKGDKAISENQKEGLINLLQWLEKKYHIKKNHVTSMKCLAYPYGNYNPYGQECSPLCNVPWKEIAQKNLTIWPKEEDVTTTIEIEDMFEQTRWVSGALYKIGFNVPRTIDENNPKFVAGLKMFQQHYDCDNQDGYITLETVGKLNSILLQCEEIEPVLRETNPPPLPRQPQQQLSQAFRDWDNNRLQHDKNTR